MPSAIRIVSNTRWFDERSIDGRPIATNLLATDGPWTLPRALFSARASDVVVINIEPRVLFALCLFRRLGALRGTRLVSVDLILSREPAGTWRRAAFRMKRWLLKAVDLLVLYYPDTGALRSLYQLPAERVVYVPFKVNNRDALLASEPEDGGYVLACGRSKRDYATFAAAMAQLPDVQAIVLAPLGEEADEHGSASAGVRFPANVRVVRDDGSAASWLEWLRRARLVVLPIIPDTLAPSGISTYLGAMALGKCVVITDSPASRGMIESGEAIIVPPSDSAALREAVRSVHDDATLRRRIADTGRAYALRLGDESRLADDMVGVVERMLRSQEGRDSSPPLKSAHSHQDRSAASTLRDQ